MARLIEEREEAEEQQRRLEREQRRIEEEQEAERYKDRF